MDIETSTACNRRCSYCPNVYYDNTLLKNNSLMSEEVFLKIISDLGNERYS
ncbi:MAG: hypothetical protein LBQ59_05230 [Candidatus Peribacteria bacterium]|nr:hypothetical protein [Candidatus Peribacteria bacterium]